MLNWFNGARWRLSLSHCLEGLIIQVPISILVGVWPGALSVVVWYWSRKKLEMELKNLAPGASHVSTWSVGWFPWQWPAYYVLDVTLPAISATIVAYIFK